MLRMGSSAQDYEKCLIWLRALTLCFWRSQMRSPEIVHYPCVSCRAVAQACGLQTNREQRMNWRILTAEHPHGIWCIQLLGTISLISFVS